jgi:hypothetical protein
VALRVSNPGLSVPSMEEGGIPAKRALIMRQYDTCCGWHMTA